MENLFHSVARHAELSAEKTALSRRKPGSDFIQTSYRDLLRAARLCASVFSREPSVALLPILAGKSAESIAAMLGAVAVRRPFCFLNPKYRAPQIAAALEASGAPLCAVDAAGLIALNGAWQNHPQISRTSWLLMESGLTGIPARVVDELRRVAPVIDFPQVESVSIEPKIHSDDCRADTVGTCLFTSGSTGTPKGVLIGEEDLMRRTAAEIEAFSLTGNDVLLSVLPFSFDVGLNQLLSALVVGAELVLLDSWLPSDISAAIERRKVTGIAGVPAIWQDLIQSGIQLDKQGKHASLRYLTISGGSLSRQSLQRLPEVVPEVQIFKTYGQTEAFRATLLRPEDYHRKPDSVGRPFAGVRVYVVREDGTRCNWGEAGEVVHTGLGVMMGYLGSGVGAEPDGKLRENPFWGSDDPARLAVFTGDMGHLDEEGFLFLEGRQDTMLKVMGNRVYPQEVAHQILTISGVRDAVVTSVANDSGQAVILAFVALLRGSELSIAELRKELNRRLPSFMVPKQIILVDEIPRTASGKPDARTLVERHTAAGLLRTEPAPEGMKDGD